MIKIGPMVCFDMVGKSAFCPLFGKALQHPSHITADIAHGLKTFQVIANFIGRHAVNHVPIRRRNDRHAGNAKVFVQDIDSRCRTAAAGRNDGSSRLPAKTG